MRFEARELKSYAEPVSARDLRENEVYFSVQFVDDRLLVPIVLPLVYVGANLAKGDVELFYFQDFESYSAGVKYFTEDESRDFHVRGPNDLNHIFDYEHALESLMKCSLRRRELRGSSI